MQLGPRPIADVHWEHYAQRVEAMDMPSLDEGNFLAGSAGVLLSSVTSLIGVLFGADNVSPYLIAVLGFLIATSALLTIFFTIKYSKAKKALTKTGTQICKEMREVAEDQRRRAGAATIA